MGNRIVFLLIEPYWNVNVPAENWPDNWIDLLIEPYWNVNFAFLPFTLFVAVLLIEPYWNVNTRDDTAINWEPLF